MRADCLATPIRRSLPIANACFIGIIAVVVGRESCGAVSVVGVHASIERLSANSSAASLVIDGLPTDVLAKLPADGEGSEVWKRVFAVRVGTTDSNLPTVLGKWSRIGERIAFEPRFPWRPGVAYQVTCDWSLIGASESVEALPSSLEFSATDKSLATVPLAEVTEVYPSQDELPENVLKFYIHFSSPMSRGESYRCVTLWEVGGARSPRQIEAPFLELGEELWDRSGTRFTLLLDPGRIKRGLKPREDVGPVFEEGKTYRLVIDQSWQDSHGRPMKQSFERQFRISTPDDMQPDVSTWQNSVPTKGTREALALSFPEPLDDAMLRRVLAVYRGTPDRREGDTLLGSIVIDDGQQRWRFFPESPWQPGEYVVEVDATLEDRAGNSLGRPFEIDVLRDVEAAVPNKKFHLSFKVH